jgi:hypothetical protein
LYALTQFALKTPTSLICVQISFLSKANGPRYNWWLEDRYIEWHFLDIRPIKHGLPTPAISCPFAFFKDARTTTLYSRVALWLDQSRTPNLNSVLLTEVDDKVPNEQTFGREAADAFAYHLCCSAWQFRLFNEGVSIIAFEATDIASSDEKTLRQAQKHRRELVEFRAMLHYLEERQMVGDPGD